MKNLKEPAVATEIIRRINSLKADSTRQWGKMNVAQMLAHCSIALENSLGAHVAKQGLMGKLFGKLAKKTIVGPQPMKQGMPTAPSFVVNGDKDFATEQLRLANLVARFSKSDIEELAKNPHPFFGKMTGDEWNSMNYKHLDHHLRQFGA